MGRRLARVPQPAFHAAADVEEHRDADAGGVALEIGDCASFAAVEHLEVARLQILNEAAPVIADNGGNPHDVDARLERNDRRRWLLRGDSLLRTGAIEAEAQAEHRRAEDEVVPLHGGLQSKRLANHVSHSLIWSYRFVVDYGSARAGLNRVRVTRLCRIINPRPSRFDVVTL